MDPQGVVGIHPPKVHQIDLPGRRHHIWGRWWSCDSVSRFAGGLHPSRAMLDHPEIAHLDAYFLPALGLIANRFRAHDGGPHLRWSINIARTMPGPETWQALDLHLDVVIGLDGQLQVLDTDLDTNEYLAAVAGGQLNRAEAAFALTKAHDLLSGLARHGGSLPAWLAARGTDLPGPGEHPG